MRINTLSVSEKTIIISESTESSLTLRRRPDRENVTAFDTENIISLRRRYITGLHYGNCLLLNYIAQLMLVAR